MTILCVSTKISPHHTSHIIASHQTSDITSHHITHYKPKEENTKKKFLGRVLGPDRRNLTTSHIRRNLTTSHITHHCISPDIRHHISPHHTSQAERREHKEEVLGPSSWTGWLITPHHTSHMHISSHHITHHTFISHHIKHHTFTCHHITHHKPKEENTKKKFLGRVLGPDGSSHHITHHTCTSHHTTSHTRASQKNEKYENYHVK